MDSRLIEEYAPLVKYIAGRIAIGLPKQVEVDDLIGYGIIGLADALLRYESNRGAKFTTYASVRIRGAIFDGLRKMDWVPHSVRTKAKELENIIRLLETELGRTPTGEEIAATMGITLQEYYQKLDQVKATSLISLDESVGTEPEGDLRVIDLVGDEQATQDFQAIEREEVQQVLARAVELLPEKEKLVVALYYQDELTLQEIAAVLNVSESRISQLHTQAILRLRGRLSRSKNKLF
ncbi:MAG: FliA/WhiG family RNA polymerase sigma factor [Peptococcaceae bacterium]|nr:FliA/WhiG family RNA polymerase sigma factor [Peptococcaceae bacterium]